MRDLALWLMGEKGPVTYYEWKLNSLWPGWLSALILLALGAYVLFFYFRQRGLSPWQRGLWAGLRMLAFAAILLLLLDPVAIVEHSVPARQGVVLLCDSSASMSIRDARHSDGDVAEAALALNKVPFPDSVQEKRLGEALRAVNRASRTLREQPVAAADAQARALAALDALQSAAPEACRAALCVLLQNQQGLSFAVQAGSAPQEELSRAEGRISSALEELAPQLRLPVKVDDAVQKSVQVRRVDLLKALLAHPRLQLLEELRKRFDLHVYSFGNKLQCVELSSNTPGKESKAADDFSALQASDDGTALGSAIEEAIERNTGQPLAGMVLFTDGAANKGLDPVEAARHAGEAGVPLFAVPLGVADARDVILRGITAQEVAHVGDDLPVRVELDSHGCTGRQADLVLALGPDEVARKRVTLSGAPQSEELHFSPKHLGAFVLKASLAPFDDESNKENNAAQQFLKVIDEKVRVLYVEGSPRWEYRYLRRVLLRDPRLDVKFLMTEGDPDLPQHSDRYLAEFPRTAAEAFRYDLVILGDVATTKLSAEQMERIEEMVRKRGASFLMIAGHFYAPRDYAGTPIEKLLPVTPSRAPAMQVPPTLRVRLTPEGERSAIMRLDEDAAVSQGLWGLVNPLLELPRLDGAKTSATVLASLSMPLLGGEDKRAQYPLIAWQRYGTGKAMYIGTDQLWRLRFKRGDKYHARFWNQAIQVLTFSRLLGENKRITIETDQKEYQIGTRVQLTVNARNEVFEPLKVPQFTVEAQALGRKANTVPVLLQPVPDSPGLYQGYYTPEQAGVVSFCAQGALKSDGNVIEVNVIDQSLEMQETQVQLPLLRQMAAQSGGRCFGIRELPLLPDWLEHKQLTETVRNERRLVFPLFLLVLLCVCSEWFLRRKNDLC